VRFVAGAVRHNSSKEGIMADVLVVVSKVKAYLKGKGCNTSGEAIDEISKRMQMILDMAAKRTEANGRKTVKAQDI
jgi:histone H3/H4